MELGRALAAPISAAIAIACIGGFGATASASTFTVLGEFQTGTAASSGGMGPAFSDDAATNNTAMSNRERAETSSSSSCGSIGDDGSDGRGCGADAAGKLSAGAGSSGGIAARTDGGTSAGEADGGPIEAVARSQDSTADSQNAIPETTDRRQQIAALVSEASNSAVFDSFDVTRPQSSGGGGGRTVVRSDLEDFAFAVAANDSDRSFLKLTTGDTGVAGSSGGGSGGSGALAPTPLPAAVWMLLAGLAAILGMGRWRRRPAEAGSHAL